MAKLFVDCRNYVLTVCNAIRYGRQIETGAAAMIYRRRKITAEETAANAARRAAKLALSMTCQCCARQIFAETGTIAHHGYERPGTGWQTSSCMGAKHLPFEVSRDELGHMIEAIENKLARTRKHLDDVNAERVAVLFHYTRRVKGYSAQSIEHYVEVTRETFDDVKAAYEFEMLRRSMYRFDDVKARTVSNLETDIKHTDEFRAEQQARFDGWKQTHRRDGDKWVAL